MNVVDMNGIEKGVVDIDEAVIRDKIKVLLELAYEELDKPMYDGYPTSDHVACFLDAEEILGSEFNSIFNDVVPDDYKDNLEEFKKKMIEPRLNTILDSLSQLEDSKKNNFDFFSKVYGVICNMALSSALLTMYTYANRNRGWMLEKKNMLEKSTELLLKTHVSKKGWQYHSINGEKNHVHTCSTWLSLLALTYAPKEIMTDELRDRIKTYKEDLKDWLIENVRRVDNRCSWCFRPEEFGDIEYGENTSDPVATAQAILALYRAGMDIHDEIIKYSIEFIKDQKTYVEDLTLDEIPIVRATQRFQGIQHCLHALLIFGIPFEDETVQYFLKKVIGTEGTTGIVDRVYSKQRRNRTEVERTSYYTTLFPLLLYLHPPTYKEPVLLDSTRFKNEFESFVSRADSIVLVGGIDTTYANLIKSTNVTVYYQDGQDECVLNPKWTRHYVDCRLNYINCVIVDESKIMFSNSPFRVMNRYNICNYLEGSEVSEFIKQIEEIDGKVIRKDWMDKIFELEDVNKFQEHKEIMKQGLEALQNESGYDTMNGILEYFALRPEYTEIAPLTLGFKNKNNRRVVEGEFSKHGIFSRVFANDTLKKLMERNDEESRVTEFLVLDESSAYLLLNTEGTDGEIKAVECCSECLSQVSKLYVVSEVYDDFKKFLKGGGVSSAKLDALNKIEDDSIYITKFDNLDKATNDGKELKFSKNEQIVIGFVVSKFEEMDDNREKLSIITNSWEVVKMCDKYNINVFSILKFLKNLEEGDDGLYKLFRVPKDVMNEIKNESEAIWKID